MIRRSRRAVAGALVLALVALVGPSPAQAPAGKGSVREVNYDELTRLVRGHKGKVLVVDFWASWCVPCMKELPHLVELHKKYGKDGFAAVGVVLLKEGESKDGEKGGRAKAERFLTKIGATFDNVLLTLPPKEWQARLNIREIPCVFVFDRANRIVRKYPLLDAKGESIDFDYGAVEKVVVGLLKK